MVYVPSAEDFGFSLRLDESAMRELLNSGAVKAFVSETGGSVAAGVVGHIEATASAQDAQNYVESMFVEDADSDDYGFDLGGAYALGNRPIAVIGVPHGRGTDPTAKPPMLLEAHHHALTAVPGIEVGGLTEDIR